MKTFASASQFIREICAICKCFKALKRAFVSQDFVRKGKIELVSEFEFFLDLWKNCVEMQCAKADFFAEDNIFKNSEMQSLHGRSQVVSCDCVNL